MSLLDRIGLATSVGLAILVGGCDAPCMIDDQIAEYAGDIELKDCGDLKAPPPGRGYDECWIAAREWILAADLARTPYVVRAERFQIEGIDHYAYVGLGTSGGGRVVVCE